jgi:hypothetical protein
MQKPTPKPILKPMTSPERPWSVPIRIDNVPDEGAHVTLSADHATRVAIAALTSLRALPRLEAAFDVTREGSALHVVGEVSATAGQVCVVTLEPVENEIREAVDVAYAPGPDAEFSEAEPDSDAFESGSHAVAAREPPERLIDGTVDLGALTIEFLLLGIDPYPRKAGVVFEAPRIGDAKAHPFAALAKLKEKQDPGSE